MLVLNAETPAQSDTAIYRDLLSLPKKIEKVMHKTLSTDKFSTFYNMAKREANL